MTVKNPRPKEQFNIGSVFKTNNYGDIEIVEYRNCYDVLVKFDDGTIVTSRTTNIKNGEVRNPNKPTIYNRGFYGIGETLPSKSREYVMWVNMFHRCYSNTYPSYEGVTVCNEWYNFQNFIKWVREQPNWNLKNFSLDKDLKILGNKIYSPLTCVILPTKINSYLVKSNHSRKHPDLPKGVTYSSCGNYFQVQWREDKHHSKYFKTVDAAKAFWVKHKRKNTVKLVETFDKFLTNDIKTLLLNYKWEEM